MEHRDDGRSLDTETPGLTRRSFVSWPMTAPGTADCAMAGDTTVRPCARLPPSAGSSVRARAKPVRWLGPRDVGKEVADQAEGLLGAFPERDMPGID
jgi:hypothetical protein